MLSHPLHIQLGLVRQFVKGLGRGGEAFQDIRLLFPKLSEAKVKGGIFTAPQGRTILRSAQLENVMSGVERDAWCARPKHS